MNSYDVQMFLNHAFFFNLTSSIATVGNGISNIGTGISTLANSIEKVGEGVIDEMAQKRRLDGERLELDRERQEFEQRIMEQALKDKDTQLKYDANLFGDDIPF